MGMMLEALVALGIGGLVGLEREWRRKLVGIRTFMIISLLGFLSFRAAEISTLIVPVALLSVVILSARQEDYLESSTYVASVVVFLLGGMVASGNSKYAAGVALVMMALLALKDTLHHFAYSFTEKEIIDIVKMGALVLVILPLLPNRVVDPWGLFNPFRIWLMAVAILGLSFMAYMLVKFLGAKAGLLLTAVLGGLASSTALTFRMMDLDQEMRASGLAGATAFLGCLTMFVKVPLVLAIFMPSLALEVAPKMAVVFAVGMGLAAWMFRKEPEEADINIKNPLDFVAALKFVAFFVVVSALAYAAQLRFGSTGACVASFIGGFTDTEPVALSAVNMAGSGAVSMSTAAVMVYLAAFANTLTKGGLMLVKGNQEHGTKKLGLILIALSLILFFPV